jgi:hypothetical protein
MGIRFTAHFTPEAWVNDNAIEVDADGPQEWDCTAYALANQDYLTRLEVRDMDGEFGVVDNDDRFKHDPAAPQWVRDWHGPCTIRIREVSGSGGEPDAQVIAAADVKLRREQVERRAAELDEAMEAHDDHAR